MYNIMNLIPLLYEVENQRLKAIFPPSYDIKDLYVPKYNINKYDKYIHLKNEKFQLADEPLIEDNKNYDYNAILLPGFVVAGGALLHKLIESPIISNDIDIFYYNPNPLSDADFMNLVLEQAKKIILTLIDHDPSNKKTILEKLIDLTSVRNINEYEESNIPLMTIMEGVLSININNTIFQIILRQYPSVEHIINSFDLFASQVAYDGKRWYLTELFIFSLQTGCQPIDSRRHSPSYENRIYKYYSKKYIGFIIPILYSKLHSNVKKIIFNSYNNNNNLTIEFDKQNKIKKFYKDYISSEELSDYSIQIDDKYVFYGHIINIYKNNIVIPHPIIYTNPVDLVNWLLNVNDINHVRQIKLSSFIKKEAIKRVIYITTDNKLIIDMKEIYKLDLNIQEYVKKIFENQMDDSMSNDTEEIIDLINENYAARELEKMDKFYEKCLLNYNYIVSNVDEFAFSSSRKPNKIEWDDYYLIYYREFKNNIKRKTEDIVNGNIHKLKKIDEESEEMIEY